MEFILLPILYALSGFFMKISDDFFDEKNNKLWASIIGILCGITCGLIASNNVDGAYIFLGILIGNILALKVDGIHHITTLIVFILILLLFNIPSMNILILIIIVLSAIIDELGNDNEQIYNSSKFLMYFFDYRFTLKVVILLLCLLGFLNIWTFPFFLCFDVSYEIGRVLFDRYLTKLDI